MRLRSLEVESFRVVRSAQLTFGRGLNVLYGPNDLGKSTLGEAIRAAFLVPISAAEAKSYVSWGGADLVPRVVVIFEESGAVWRVEKSFGSDRRGQAALTRSDDDGATFIPVAKGRDVDGTLRDLLSWGVLPPGGRGASPRESYLTTALLGRQGDVDAIFEASLTDDGHDSGRSLVTRALDALGQDQVVSRLLEWLKERTDQAFTASGRHRQGAGAPLANLRADLTARESRLRELEEKVRKGKEIQDRVCTLLEERDDALTQRDQAKTLLAGLRRRVEAARQRREQQDSFDAHSNDLERIVIAETALDKARQDYALTSETAHRFDEEHRREEEAARQVEHQAQEAKEILAGAKIASDNAHELATSALEKSRVELEAKMAAANSRGIAARDALASAGAADVLEAELETVRNQLAAAAEDVKRAALLETVAIALAEEQRARNLVATAQAAEVTHAKEAAAERLTAQAVEECEKVHATARATVDAARAALADANRASEEHEFRSRTLRTTLSQAEAAEGDARRAVVRAKDALDRIEGVTDAERTLVETRSRVEDLESQLVANAEEASRCEADLRVLSAVSLHLRRRALNQQIDTLSHEEERARGMRASAVDGRARAARMEADLARRRLPTADGLAALTALASERQRFDATSPKAVPPPIAPPVLVGLLVGALVMIWTRSPFVIVGSTLIAATASAMLLVLWRRRAARQSWQSTRDRLAGRWKDEADPVLREAGVSDITGLGPVCQAAANERVEVERLRDEAAPFDREADGAVVAASSLASLRRERDDLSERLAGLDEHTLDDESAPFEGDRSRVAQQIASRRSRIDELRPARERLLEERNRTTTLQEAASTRADQLRSERDQALAIVGDPATALLAAEQRAAEARAEADGIRVAIAAFEEAGGSTVADHEHRVRAAQDAVAQAADDTVSRRRERDTAATALANAEARRDVAARDTRGIDLSTIELRSAAAMAEAGIDSDHLPAADDAKRNHDQAKERAVAQSARVDALAARLTDASARSGELGSKLGTGAVEALGAAETEIESARAALEALGTHSSAAIEEAATRVRETSEAASDAASVLAEAKRLLDAATLARDAARATRDRAQGELETRQSDVEGTNRAAAEAALAEARKALDATPSDQECAPGEVEVAEEQLEARDHELEQREGDLREARGKLDVVGGPDAADRLEDEREALERAREYATDQELEYGASLALQQALVSVDAKRASHLGRCLARPVTEGFLALTGNRYSQLHLDPDLRAEGIAVAGSNRKIEHLSVGTREQLATLIRLAIAAQLRTAILLDDQLVQSDSWRLDWFRGRLRASVKEHDYQVIVLTCRPTDYVAEGEMPEAVAGRLDSNSESLAVVDLSRATTRA